MSKPISPMRLMVWSMRRERHLRECASAVWPYSYGLDKVEWGPMIEAIDRWPTPAEKEEQFRHMMYCEFSVPCNFIKLTTKETFDG